MNHEDEYEKQLNLDLASGYTKRILSKPKNEYIIPFDIIGLIVYYFRDVDIWDQTTTNRVINVEDNLIKTGDIGWPYRMAFGSDDISKPTIKKWHLSIPLENSRILSDRIWSVIGIIASNKVNLNIIGNFYNKQNYGFGLKGWNGTIFHGDNKPMDGGKYTVRKLYKGDKIVMVLNMQQATLGYIINGIHYGVSFDVNKNESYRLCVAMCKNSQMILHK